ncbi:MAG: beta-lactamase family protein [Pseudomonadota bacterium]|nr:beta-lactamase family protein [Pseudomonadota bacterium]
MRNAWMMVVALMVGGVSPAGSAAEPAKNPRADPIAAINAAIPAIDRMFVDFQLDAHAPGLVYGIVADGRLIHVKAIGTQDLEQRRPVTADSLFRIASMTKSFTALSILKLRDDGKLALDDLAETHVPEMRGWRYPTSDSPRIRVRDLLNHSAGFVTDDPWGDRQQPMPEAEFTALLRTGVPFTRPPGIAMEYSNLGYALLGRIVANVSGMPYRTYVEQNLLTPLGMTSSGFDVPASPIERRAIGYRWENNAWTEEPTMAHGVFGAMGGLQTSANDYAKYIAWLLSAWPARDGAESGPLRRSSVRELAQGSNFARSRQRSGKIGATACKQASAYGMGMIAAADCELGDTLSHGGGYPGYGSHVMLLPDQGIGIFAFTNRTYTGASGVVWDAAMALHGAGALIGRPSPASPALASTYAAVAAIYRAGEVGAAGNMLAMNFLMDRSANSWKADLSRLKQEVGDCDTRAPVTASGALSGKFEWRCATGRIEGSLLLAPTTQPSIQQMELKVVKP